MPATGIRTSSSRDLRLELVVLPAAAALAVALSGRGRSRPSSSCCCCCAGLPCWPFCCWFGRPAAGRAFWPCCCCCWSACCWPSCLLLLAALLLVGLLAAALLAAVLLLGRGSARRARPFWPPPRPRPRLRRPRRGRPRRLPLVALVGRPAASAGPVGLALARGRCGASRSSAAERPAAAPRLTSATVARRRAAARRCRAAATLGHATGRSWASFSARTWSGRRAGPRCRSGVVGVLGGAVVGAALTVPPDAARRERLGTATATGCVGSAGASALVGSGRSRRLGGLRRRGCSGTLAAVAAVGVGASGAGCGVGGRRVAGRLDAVLDRGDEVALAELGEPVMPREEASRWSSGRRRRAGRWGSPPGGVDVGHGGVSFRPQSAESFHRRGCTGCLGRRSDDGPGCGDLQEICPCRGGGSACRLDCGRRRCGREAAPTSVSEVRSPGALVSL